ncbi:MAG TPA: VOC family protein [Candidatus Saccharimonadales bacterium]|nr:VOC family protein [Candidatus Saccharimonadales bacterium]
MLSTLASFSSFSVDDMAKAKAFYTQTLGLKLADETMGLNFELPGGGKLFVYQKDDHQPASFTVLNFVVADIDAAIGELQKSGVSMEHYDNLPGKQDDKGVLRGLAAHQGPDIAWCKDPAGNVLAIIQDQQQS